MEPFPNTAVAAEWEFRCHGKEVPGHPWDWQCRAKDGTIVAMSGSYFKTLREAVTNAASAGFQFDNANGAASL